MHEVTRVQDWELVVQRLPGGRGAVGEGQDVSIIFCVHAPGQHDVLDVIHATDALGANPCLG